MPSLETGALPSASRLQELQPRGGKTAKVRPVLGDFAQIGIGFVGRHVARGAVFDKSLPDLTRLRVDVVEGHLDGASYSFGL